MRHLPFTGSEVAQKHRLSAFNKYGLYVYLGVEKKLCLVTLVLA